MVQKQCYSTICNIVEKWKAFGSDGENRCYSWNYSNYFYVKSLMTFFGGKSLNEISALILFLKNRKYLEDFF